MANGVSGGGFFYQKTVKFWKNSRFWQKNSTVVFFKFIILNVFIYGVSNLLFGKFFVDKNVLSPGLIVTKLFLRFIFVLIFCLVLVILIPIVAQLFFIFVANVVVVWLVMGPISTVFNIVPYKISCGNCFKFSMYDYSLLFML